MTRELRPAQRDIVEYIIESMQKYRACAAFASMGVGKTGAVLNALDIMHMAGTDVYPTLVCAPIRVAQNTWPAEVSEWVTQLPDMRISAIVGEPKNRENAIVANAQIFTVNNENIPWLVEYFKSRNLPWPYKTVVIDESTSVAGLRVSIQNQKGGKPCKPFLAGQGNVRAKALMEMVWMYRCMVIELTGTPATLGLVKLWGQAFFLDMGQRLGRTFTAFEDRFYLHVHGADGYTKRAILPTAEAEIHRQVQGICRTFDAKDYYDVKDPITVPIYVDLPPLAAKQYREMEKKFFTEIKNHQIEAFNAGSKSQKIQQISNGACYVGEDDGSDARPWVQVHDAKLDALNSVIEEANGAPVVAVYFFKSDLARLKKKFPQGVTLDKKKETENRWNRGEIPVLFVHYQSAGHGVNLQHGGNIIALFSMIWSLELYLQVIERLGPMRQMQSGYDRPVWVYQILARNTIDEEMVERQATHRDTMDLLLEAAKKRG